MTLSLTGYPERNAVEPLLTGLKMMSDAQKSPAGETPLFSSCFPDGDVIRGFSEGKVSFKKTFPSCYSAKRLSEKPLPSSHLLFTIV